MAATGTPTPNIGLRIPLGTDPASVDDINYNSNLLDTKLGAVGSDSVQDQIDTLNSNIGSLRKLKYMDLTDTTPMNVNSQSSYTIGSTNFIGCASRTSGVMPLPYMNNNVLYIKLVNYSDLSPFSGSATVRVWYV